MQVTRMYPDFNVLAKQPRGNEWKVTQVIPGNSDTILEVITKSPWFVTWGSMKNSAYQGHLCLDIFQLDGRLTESVITATDLDSGECRRVYSPGRYLFDISASQGYTIFVWEGG